MESAAVAVDEPSTQTQEETKLLAGSGRIPVTGNSRAGGNPAAGSFIKYMTARMPASVRAALRPAWCN